MLSKIPIFLSFRNFIEHDVSIEYESVSDAVLSDKKVVGVGCSIGIDSLSSIFGHWGEICIDGCRATHLAVFNCGHFGTESKELADTSFQKFLSTVRLFADEMNLKTVFVNTNITDFWHASGVTWLNSFTYNTIGCALALQKLFGKYIYASSYPSTHFYIDYRNDVSHSEALLVPQLSTESCDIILSDPFASRVQKTAFISQFQPSYKYLSVCWSDQISNHPGLNTKYSAKSRKNCGWCDKCMRTLLTLELLGCLEKYSEIFDMQKYYAHRRDFIIKVVANSQSNVFYKEIYGLMIMQDFKIPKIALVLRFLNIKQTKLVVWLWHEYKHIRYESN